MRKSLVFKRNKFGAKIRDNSVLSTKVKGYILIVNEIEVDSDQNLCSSLLIINNENKEIQAAVLK